MELTPWCQDQREYLRNSFCSILPDQCALQKGDILKRLFRRLEAYKYVLDVQLHSDSAVKALAELISQCNIQIIARIRMWCARS